MDIQKEIIRVTSEYLEDNIDFLKLSNTTKEYKSILNGICGQNMDIDAGRSDIEHENGKALGTLWAALCLDDIMRTRQFIRGIDQAIKEKIKKKPIHILYAGTGPFATLILPFFFRYAKQDIKYTLLEVNPFTFNILQNVISKLGLEGYNITLVNDDATKYQIDPNNEPDIIISETMQNALAKEQQVPIFLNLMSQVKHDPIFIPEKIELYIGHKKAGIPIEKLHKKHYNKIDKVFEVSKESMFSANPSEKQSTQSKPFSKKKTVIENEILTESDILLIITEIQVYKNEKIGVNDSGLTTPTFIYEIPNNLKGVINVDTQYIISSEPKLDYKVTLPNN